MDQASILNTSIVMKPAAGHQSSWIAKLALAMAAVVFVAPTLGAAEVAVKKSVAASEPSKTTPRFKSRLKPRLDRSGSRQVGEASIYAQKFANKRMADGNKMDPMSDNAASKTLPFGTRARVTNLETGQSTEVTIQDRGPHVKGRIIDLPQAKAEEIGISIEEGVAQVEVAPIEVPQRDGSVKPGDGALDRH